MPTINPTHCKNNAPYIRAHPSKGQPRQTKKCIRFITKCYRLPFAVATWFHSSLDVKPVPSYMGLQVEWPRHGAGLSPMGVGSRANHIEDKSFQFLTSINKARKFLAAQGKYGAISRPKGWLGRRAMEPYRIDPLRTRGTYGRVGLTVAEPYWWAWS